MYQHEKIDYIEMPATDFEGTKSFFEDVFGWQLEDAGPDYLAFTDQGATFLTQMATNSQCRRIMRRMAVWLVDVSSSSHVT
ncbi:MAG: hypothetical protein GKR90_22430 [Pseudomonadales bacterium]|nr:hypothetical protein [Pseudomonadales bacterium]